MKKLNLALIIICFIIIIGSIFLGVVTKDDTVLVFFNILGWLSTLSSVWALFANLGWGLLLVAVVNLRK